MKQNNNNNKNNGFRKWARSPWFPECTGAKTRWRRIQGMWAVVHHGNWLWEEYSVGFCSALLTAVVVRSWVSLLGPELVLLVSVLWKWLFSNCKRFDVSFINVISGPNQKMVIIQVSPTRQLHLAGVVGKPLELKNNYLNYYLWLLMEARGFWRFKNAQPAAIL